MIVVRWVTTLLVAVLTAPAGPESTPAKPSAEARGAETPSWDIPIALNDDVDRWLVYFQTRGRERFALYLSRAGKYEPMMRATLRDHGLPEDLIYLSLIESGYNPNAYSRAHAVGLWQFISSTGRQSGLRIDYWVDERRDPVLATRAAAAHLKDLYEEFGSWYLAAAAYNGGRNRVRRSIRRSGSRDFWTLAQRRYLRPETRNYVPKLIAAALIAKDPARYSFRVEPAPALKYDVVWVPDATSLDVIAEAAGVEVDEVIELNPQLRRGMTPPGERYAIRLPRRSGTTFAVNFPKIRQEDRVRSIQYAVRRGDTLSRIARRYGSDVSAILARNPGLNPRRLRVGQRLFIPTAPQLPLLASAD